MHASRRRARAWRDVIAVRAPRILGCALALACTLLVTGGAHAQQRVALAALSGRGHEDAATRLREALAAGAFVVVEDTAPIADEVDAAAALCARLGVAAVLGGEAVRRGDRWRFDLFARDAAGAEWVRVRRPARGPRALAEAVDALVARLAALPPPVVATSVPPPETTNPDVSEAESERGTAPEAAAVRGDETISRDGDGSSAHRVVAFSAWLGAGMRTRTVTLIAPNGEDAGYAAPGFVELALGAEARFVDVLFVRGAASTSAGLRSRPAEPGRAPLDSWFASASVDLGARVTLDDAFELGLAAGVGWDRYALPFNEQVPTIAYAYVRPGALAAARVLGDTLVLEAEGGVRLPFAVGDLEALYGEDHVVRGFDVTLRLRGVVGPGLLWRVEGGYRAYSLAFRTVDGTFDGRDQGYHAHAHAGWTF